MAKVTKGFVLRPKYVGAQVSSSINLIDNTIHLSFTATEDESETPKRLRVVLSEEEINYLIRFWNNRGKDPKEWL